MKQAASFARDESIAAYQQLASKIEGTEAQIGQYLKTQQSGMDRSSLQKDVNSLWDVVSRRKINTYQPSAQASNAVQGILLAGTMLVGQLLPCLFILPLRSCALTRCAA